MAQRWGVVVIILLDWTELNMGWDWGVGGREGLSAGCVLVLHFLVRREDTTPHALCMRRDMRAR